MTSTDNEGTGAHDGMRPVLNAVRVLEMFADGEELGVSVLSRRLDLPKATVQRLLTTLNSAGWLAPTTAGPKRWRVGPGLLALSSRLLDTHDLRVATRDLLARLCDETKETVQLVVPYQQFAVGVQRFESSLPVRAFTALGQPVPLHAGAGGKAILSHYSEERVIELLPPELERYTSNSLPDIDALLKQLRHARAVNYAVNAAEWRDGVRAVGSAILDGRGEPVAAIVISAPAERLSDDRIKSLGLLLSEAVQTIH